MNAKQFDELLHDHRACPEAVKWAHGKTLAQVWKTCERGDWLLWLAGRMSDKPGWPTRQQVVLAACACAELALPFVANGEDRPRIAIETARRWVHGKATIEDVRIASRAAAAAAAAAYAADAAAAYAAYAAAAAAYAADAADAADAAATYAAYAVLKQCADLVRKQIPVPYVIKVGRAALASKVGE